MQSISEQADVRSHYSESKERNRPSSWSAAMLGRVLQKVIRRGRLVVIDHDGSRWECGAETCEDSLGTPVVVRVLDARLYKRLVANGSLGLGESYADGWWEVEGEKLCEFFSVLFANNIDRLFMGGMLPRLLTRFRSWRRYRDLYAAAREDIHLHYDLSNDFFRLMLDPSMTYSCGYALEEGDSLETMQQQKLARIARKLDLQRGGRLLDIGCGWGGLLAYVGEHYPQVEGIGVTLSEEQYDFARQRLSALGLSNRMKVQLLDFRDITGRFDAVVSVGMFEHVGLSSYGDFFDVVQRSLSPAGRALLHTIGVEEDPGRRQDPWVDKYIFPGSRLPRLEELVQGARRANLAVGHVENWRPHYALTLEHWRKNFKRNWQKISGLGKKFDSRFFKMWDLYLQLSEACFIDSTVELYQVLLSPRPRWNFPLSFDFGA